MAVEFLINRLKTLVLLLVGIFRRAVCCFRRRRRSSCESIPLATVGVVPNTLNTTELEQWEQWEENPVVVVPDRPINTIQAKIEQYRQQATKSLEPADDEQQNFFENMTPKITKQTKIMIKDKQMDNMSWNSSKFAVTTDHLPSAELGEWEENVSGWEEKTVEEFGDPTKTLRDQRRREREQRMHEQQQKRLERNIRPQPLGAKLSS